jgi:hypothetical protein
VLPIKDAHITTAINPEKYEIIIFNITCKLGINYNIIFAVLQNTEERRNIAGTQHNSAGGQVTEELRSRRRDIG